MILCSRILVHCLVKGKDSAFVSEDVDDGICFVSYEILTSKLEGMAQILVTLSVLMVCLLMYNPQRYLQLVSKSSSLFSYVYLTLISLLIPDFSLTTGPLLPRQMMLTYSTHI